MKRIFRLSFVMLFVCVACAFQLPKRASNVQGEVKANKSLGQFECLAGTKFQIAAIQSSNETGAYFSSGSSGYQSNIHNYLFMDVDKVSFTKLLDTNDLVITQTLKFHDSISKENPYEDSNSQTKCSIDTPKVRWLLYTIVKNTNKNSAIDFNALKTIAISDAEGKNYTELISNVRDVYGQSYQPELDRLIIIYRSDGVKKASIVDLSTRKVISTKLLPDLGTDVN